MVVTMMNLSNILWIGGSPCSGKTTISDELAKEFNFDVYHIDEHAFSKHLELATYSMQPSMCKLRDEGWDKIMAQPTKQCVDFWNNFYCEDMELVIKDIISIRSNKSIIVEGVCVIPELLSNINKKTINKAIFLLPSEDFFRRNLAKREKLMSTLKNAPEPKTAFENIINVYMSLANQIYFT